MNRADTIATLLDLYQAALASVAAGPVLLHALHREPPADRVWVIALGKAAHPMAEAAVRALHDRGQSPAGGLVVSSDPGPRPDPSMKVTMGDHPEPGAGSRSAADALDTLVKQIPAGDTAWVLLSGGTTSLVGAPQPGIAPDELAALYARLLRSGLDIATMNRARKRFTRWSGGRLARSLGHAQAVHCYIVSDVIGDDLSTIGSGPCVADPSTAREVREALIRSGLWDALAPSMRRHVDNTERGIIPETPKPGEPDLERVTSTLITTNRLALEAAGHRAGELGLTPEIVDAPLAGEAAEAGARLAARLVASVRHHQAPAPAHCVILGGETTVTIAKGAAGLGGRSQELALAAARLLDGAPPGVALLAAGTDGRDGPTDAAGAVVDPTTWTHIVAAGRDPQRDLDHHDSYPALASAAALIKTGPTGTNVMDVVIGIVAL